MEKHAEKDIARVETLRTQARDTDPATATTPPVQTPLEDATPATTSGANLRQKSRDSKENGEVENLTGLTLGQSAQAPVRVVEKASPATSSGPNTGKKSSRKGRNRKENKNILFLWPLTFQTRASSAASVLGPTSLAGALQAADSKGNKSKDPERRGIQKVSIRTRPSLSKPATLCPSSSAVPPSYEETSQATNGSNRMKQKSSSEGTRNKNRKTGAIPWPLTVQVWASYAAPDLAETTRAGASPVASGGVNVASKGSSQKGGTKPTSVVTSCQNTSTVAPCLASAPEQTYCEESSHEANSGINVRKKIKCKTRNRKRKRALACPWPLTVQVWVTVTKADPVQTPLQGRSPAASAGLDEGQKRSCQVQSQEEIKHVHPRSCTSHSITGPDQNLSEGVSYPEDTRSKFNNPRRSRRERGHREPQSSVEPTQDSSQGWRNPERVADQNVVECTMMTFARPAYHHYAEYNLQERMEALILTRDHTHTDTSVMWMQESDDRVTAAAQTGQTGNGNEEGLRPNWHAGS